MVYKLCWLISYGGGGGVDGDDEGGGGVSSWEIKTSKVEKAILLSLSLLYSDNNISVYNSRPSSCSAYTFY